ncbi:MAG: DUF5677 domain-containing protein [Methylococcaceae bacterium]
MAELKDILSYGIDDDVIRNLLKIAEQLDSYSQMVPMHRTNDYVGLVVKRLLHYLSKETNAAVLCFRVDIHAFAWRVRNVFEGVLLLEHVTKNKNSAEAFIAQKIGDEKTILESLLSLGSSAAENTSPIRERIDKANAVLRKHGFEKTPPWRTDFLAISAGLKYEYDAFYKLYSKYVHPSAWTILSDADEYETIQYWEIFLVQVQLHSQHALACAEAFLSTRGEFVRKNG